MEKRFRKSTLLTIIPKSIENIAIYTQYYMPHFFTGTTTFFPKNVYPIVSSLY